MRGGRARWTRSDSGFTLVELLFVVVILGLLTVAAAPRMRRSLDGVADGEVIASVGRALSQAQARSRASGRVWELSVDRQRLKLAPVVDVRSDSRETIVRGVPTGWFLRLDGAPARLYPEGPSQGWSLEILDDEQLVGVWRPRSASIGWIVAEETP